jgi:hypothetical protein
VITLPTHVQRARRRGRGRARVGDWIALALRPPTGIQLGPDLAEPAPVLAFSDVTERHGTTFTVEPAELGQVGLAIRVPRGLYHAQVTIPCRPRFPPVAPWTVMVGFAWCGDPPAPADGLPGAPEVEVWRHQTVPDGLPVAPGRGALVTESALIHVPDDNGELFVVLGATVAAETPAGECLTLHYRRVG